MAGRAAHRPPAGTGSRAVSSTACSPVPEPRSRAGCAPNASAACGTTSWARATTAAVAARWGIRDPRHLARSLKTHYGPTARELRLDW
ncbi:hypothetical protein [Streptomyces sp. DSM 40484]|uniref:hypothetical protein n=1 Tax=Streptomyces kroppenstedtii TaxID=3051181 RepID=UPI0028D7FEDB|nr:hypothetical protein [Streptomyces sp. DSM 40484]